MRTNHGNSNRQEQVPLINSLSISVGNAVKDGYVENFKVTSRGLYGISKGRYYRPEQVQMLSALHFEEHGVAATLYIIGTSDGLKGTCIDSFKNRPDPLISAFMSEVQDIRKKMSRHEQPEC